MINKKTKLLAALTSVLLTLLGSSVVLSAQETESNDDNILGVVVVTDTGKKAKVLDTNTSITVLTQEDIENSGQRTVAELVTSIPGVIGQKKWANTNISVRGTKPVSGDGPTVYIDGIPVHDGRWGYSRIDQIPIESVERIEVLKSPSAAIYGKNAAGGVILITTKKSRNVLKDFTAKVTGEYGSWNTYKGDASILGRISDFDYGLIASGTKTDAYRHTDEKSKNIGGSLGYSFDGGRAEITTNYTDTSYAYSKGLPKEYAKKHPRTTYLTGAGKTRSDVKILTSALNVRYNKDGWMGNLLSNYLYMVDDWDGKNTPQSDPDFYTYKSINENYSVKLNGGKTVQLGDNIVNTLNIGADYTNEDLDQDLDYLNDPVQSLSKDFIAKRKSLGISINNDFAIDMFKLSAGMRLNNVHYKFEYDQASTKDFDKSYGNGVDWSISPSVSLIENSNLFVSYNHSNSYSTLAVPAKNAENTSYPDRPQVKDLKPEIYDTLEAGFKHQFNKMLNYSIILYRTKISDKLVSYYITTSTWSKGYYNAGDSLHQGIELEANGRLMSMVGYRVGLATMNAEWETARDSKGNDLKGKQIKDTPKFEYRVGFDIHPLQNKAWGELTIAFDFYGFTKQYGDDLNTEEKSMDPGYFFDAKVNYSFQNISVFAKCTNLFDKYWARSSGSSFYPKDGRYMGIGLTAKI